MVLSRKWDSERVDIVVMIRAMCLRLRDDRVTISVFGKSYRVSTKRQYHGQFYANGKKEPKVKKNFPFSFFPIALLFY